MADVAQMVTYLKSLGCSVTGKQIDLITVMVKEGDEAKKAARMTGWLPEDWTITAGRGCVIVSRETVAE